MKRVTGIVGVFFKAREPKARGRCYQQHLGLNLEAWRGEAFRWATPENPSGTGASIWNPFAHDWVALRRRAAPTRAAVQTACAQACISDGRAEPGADCRPDCRPAIEPVRTHDH